MSNASQDSHHTELQVANELNYNVLLAITLLFLGIKMLLVLYKLPQKLGAGHESRTKKDGVMRSYI